MRTGNLAGVMRTLGHSDVKTAMHYHVVRRLRIE